MTKQKYQHMENLEFITTIEDVLAVAKVVLRNDPKILDWEFCKKCCVEVNTTKPPYKIKWRLLMKVKYKNGNTCNREFILDGNFNGKFETFEPLRNEYETKIIKDDREYRSFEIFMEQGFPVVKTTWHFPNSKWEDSKSVHKTGCITNFDDKPVVFLNKEMIYQMVGPETTKVIEPKLVNGLPFWVDNREKIMFCLSPHISYDNHLWPFWSPIRGKHEIKELEPGKEYPLYKTGNSADFMTNNLLSVNFDGSNFELIRPSKSSLIKK